MQSAGRADQDKENDEAARNGGCDGGSSEVCQSPQPPHSRDLDGVRWIRVRLNLKGGGTGKTCNCYKSTQIRHWILRGARKVF